MVQQAHAQDQLDDDDDVDQLEDDDYVDQRAHTLDQLDEHAHELDDVSDMDQQVHAQDQLDEVNIFEHVQQLPDINNNWVYSFSIDVVRLTSKLIRWLHKCRW